MASVTAADGDAIATLVGLLRQAMQNDQRVQSAAAGRLVELETVPRFCELLMHITTASGSFDHETRLMAVCCLLNTVRRRWASRGADTTLVAEAEKALLRQQLGMYLSEPDPVIATNVATLASRVASADWPNKWPDLLPCVLAGLTAHTNNALLFLHKIVKVKVQQASAKAPLAAAAPALFTAVNAVLQASLTELSSHGADIVHGAAAIHRAHLCTKIFRRLISHCFPVIRDMAEGQVFFASLPAVMLALNKLWVQTADVHHACRAELEQVAVKLARAVEDSQQKFALQFGGLLAPFLSGFASDLELLLHPSNAHIPEPYCRICINFVNNCADSKDYKASPAKAAYMQGRGALPTQAADSAAVIQQFFTPERMEQLSRLVIQRALALNAHELEEWQADPEAFLSEQESATKERDFRPAGEALLLTFVDTDAAAIGRLVATLLSEAEAAVAASEMTGQPILALDAVYQAMGICAYAFREYIDFETWLKGRWTFLSQVSENRAAPMEQRVLARRMLWMISCWLVAVPADVRKAFYALVPGFLAAADPVIVVTAACTLQSLLDDWGFEPEHFRPHVHAMVDALFDGVLLLTEAEGRSQLLNLLAMCLEKAGSDFVATCVDSIMSRLPQVWAAMEDQNVMRGPILSTVKHAVAALRERSITLWPVVIPLVRSATTVGHSEEPFMCSFGLELYQELVDKAPSYGSELHELFHNCVLLMQRDMEHVKPIMFIVEQYLLLGGGQFMATYGMDVIAMLQRAMDLTIDEDRSFITVTKVMERVFQLYPHDAPATAEPLVLEMINGCADEDLRTLVRIRYLTLLARLVVQAPAWFDGFLVRSFGSGREDVQRGLVTHWLTTFDDIPSSSPWEKKTWAMALLHFAAIQSPAALADLEAVLQCCVDVLVHTLSIAHLLDFGPAAEEAAVVGADRSRVAFVTDPVVSTNLQTLAFDALQAISAGVGEGSFKALMDSMSPSVMEELRDPPKSDVPYGAGLGYGAGDDANDAADYGDD